MPETVNLNTITNYTRVGSDITIYTIYNDGILPDILSSYVRTDAGSLSSIAYKEGDLMVEYKYGASLLSIYINTDGTIVIDSTDSANYSINSDGELIYTT